MSKLFLIGNGFDRAHNLPTDYEDFHTYLHTTYHNADENNDIVPSGELGHHGDIIYDDDEVVGYMMNLISRVEGVKWSDLEKSLGELDYSNDFDYLPEILDDDGDHDLFKESYNNEDQASQLAGCVPKITELFADWVDTINIDSSCAKPSIKSLIDEKKDYFINFNYTRTLEKLYGVQNICHIHGEQGGVELLFGHGAGHLFDGDDLSSYIGCEGGLEEIQDALRKDTKKALCTHKNFFDNLQVCDISDIYSFGFSFGDVDLTYLKEIFKKVPTDSLVFYLHGYDSSRHNEQIEKVRQCGYNGKFDVFNA